MVELGRIAWGRKYLKSHLAQIFSVTFPKCSLNSVQMALVLENSPFLPLLRHSHCPRLPITTQAGLLPRIKHLAAGYFPIKFSKGFFHRCCELTRNNQINQISPSERWLKCHSGRPFTIGQQTNLKNGWTWTLSCLWGPGVFTWGREWQYSSASSPLCFCIFFIGNNEHHTPNKQHLWPLHEPL